VHSGGHPSGRFALRFRGRRPPRVLASPERPVGAGHGDALPHLVGRTATAVKAFDPDRPHRRHRHVTHRPKRVGRHRSWIAADQAAIGSSLVAGSVCRRLLVRQKRGNRATGKEFSLALAAAPGGEHAGLYQMAAATPENRCKKNSDHPFLLKIKTHGEGVPRPIYRPLSRHMADGATGTPCRHRPTTLFRRRPRDLATQARRARRRCV
jgi:hypothetical protein